jgi:hypothetical protein
MFKRASSSLLGLGVGLFASCWWSLEFSGLFVILVMHTSFFFMKQEEFPPTEYIYKEIKVACTNSGRLTTRKKQSRNSWKVL